jgi:hypothetical protein
MLLTGIDATINNRQITPINGDQTSVKSLRPKGLTYYESCSDESNKELKGLDYKIKRTTAAELNRFCQR